jgi:hypothetical protein
MVVRFKPKPKHKPKISTSFLDWNQPIPNLLWLFSVIAFLVSLVVNPLQTEAAIVTQPKNEPTPTLSPKATSLKLSNPNLRTPNSELRTPNSEFRIPNSKTSNSSCPTFFRPLINHLLTNLPSYANRVLVQRQTDPNQKTYIVVVGKPDFRSLPLEPLIQSFPELHLESLADMEHVQQVFLTSLERQYHDRDLEEHQQFHWLFFKQVADEWQLIKMISQSGPYPLSYDPATPPRDSTNEPIAEAIRTQLRDCQMGSLR